MASVKDFFTLRNTVKNISTDDRKQTLNYLETIKAFARVTYKSIYIIDYEQKGFEYVSDNPLFLCGYTAQEVKELGYAFYFKHVIPSDLELLLKTNNVGFEFYERIPVEERKDYTISYDFHLKNKNGNTVLINHQLTPLFLTSEGKIWKALCIISLSNEQQAGNIKILKSGSSRFYKYDLAADCWKKVDEVKLSPREKEILLYSASGHTINQIAESIFVSVDTVKFHRRKIYNKLGVSNIAEAIAYATNNKLF